VDLKERKSSGVGVGVCGTGGMRLRRFPLGVTLRYPIRKAPPDQDKLCTWKGGCRMGLFFKTALKQVEVGV
jgi:hypothetical protein